MVVGDGPVKSIDEMAAPDSRKRTLIESTCLGTPQEFPAIDIASLPGQTLSVQIKNIKLHIVTDIKVNFNSMLGFRISIFGWGSGTFTKQRKISDLYSDVNATIIADAKCNKYRFHSTCAALVRHLT